ACSACMALLPRLCFSGVCKVYSIEPFPVPFLYGPIFWYRIGNHTIDRVPRVNPFTGKLAPVSQVTTSGFEKVIKRKRSVHHNGKRYSFNATLERIYSTLMCHFKQRKKWHVISNGHHSQFVSELGNPIAGSKQAISMFSLNRGAIFKNLDPRALSTIIKLSFAPAHSMSRKDCAKAV
ncbi:MAG: hypothetical protein ACK53V_07730, partial [Planctomycetota bacterium]